MRDESPLLLYVPDRAAQLHRVQGVDVLSPDTNLAFVGGDHPVEQAQQRGLSRATFTHERDDFTPFDG